MERPVSLVRLVFIAALTAAVPPSLCAGTAQPGTAGPSLHGFADGIHHWKNAHHLDTYPRLAPEQVTAIAENLLLYQRANGGWRENDDPQRILDDKERARIAADHAKEDSSFDNDSTWPQIAYLAGAYGATGDARFRDAALRGLDYVFSAQHPCGAFPHSFPNKDGYRPLLTFADAVTPHVLAMLRQVADGAETFAWVEAPLREKAREAVARGDAALVRLQVKIGGKPAAWAGQYDPVTLLPAKGRSFELPSVCSRESVEVLRYLTSIPSPGPEIIACVESAADWLERSALRGWRYERFKAEAVDYQYHTARDDTRLVEDPAAPRVWARFNDLETSEPVLATREGRRVAKLAEIDRERRSGYEWFGYWPEKFLSEELPAWRARVQAGKAAP